MTRSADAEKLTLSATELAKMVMCLEERQPLTNAYEDAHPPRREPWYRSQRQHLHGFWGEYDSPGAYGRAKPGQSAQFAYNHLRCVEGLMWLAEAVGVEQNLVAQGIDAVEAAGSNPSSQCAAFRRYVHWALIQRRLEGGSGPTLIARLRRML